MLFAYVSFSRGIDIMIESSLWLIFYAVVIYFCISNTCGVIYLLYCLYCPTTYQQGSMYSKILLYTSAVEMWSIYNLHITTWARDGSHVCSLPENVLFFVAQSWLLPIALRDVSYVFSTCWNGCKIQGNKHLVFGSLYQQVYFVATFVVLSNYFEVNGVLVVLNKQHGILTSDGMWFCGAFPKYPNSYPSNLFFIVTIVV